MVDFVQYTYLIIFYYSVTCNFDNNNICSWHQSTNDDFDWTLISGDTPTSFTGPPGDHTSTSGKLKMF